MNTHVSLSGLDSRRRLAAMPFGFDFPVWTDDPDLCIRSHVHPLGFGAAVSDLHKIALEKTRTPSMRRKRAAPDAAPPSGASN